MLGLGTSLVKGGKVGRTYVKDGLKLYMPYRGDVTNKGTQFVGTGSTYFTTNDYIGIADDSTLDITDNLTVSCWAKNDSAAIGAEQAFASKYKSSGEDSRSWLWSLNTAEKLVLTTSDDGESGTMSHTSDSAVSSVNTWNHYAFTFVGGTVALYVNGVSVANTRSGETQTAIASDDADMSIGSISEAGGFYWEGNIKNVAIWSRALTATEVQNVMYKTYAEVSGRLASGLVSWWALELSSLYTDSTGTNDGTNAGSTQSGYDTLYGGNTPVIPRGIDNAPTVQADAIGAGSALFVDSNTDYITMGDVIDQTTNAYSITAWIKTDGSGNFADNVIASKRDGSSVGWKFFLESSTNKVRLFVYDGSTDSGRYGATNVGDGEWHHVAAVSSSANNVITIYVDGVNDAGTASLNTINTITNDGNFTIGVESAGSADPWDGNICQVGIWQGVLTQAEVQSIMEKTFEELTAVDKSILGAELVTGFENSVSNPWETFAGSSGNTVTSLINSSGSAEFETNEVGGTTTDVYKIVCTLTINGGSPHLVAARHEGSYTVGDFKTGTTHKALVTGTNTYHVTFTSTDRDYLWLVAGGSSDDISDVTLSCKLVTHDLVSYWALDEADGNGVVDKVDETLGSELITNGTFDTDSGWTKGSGWTISDGTATHDSTGGTTELTQSVSLTNDVLYKVQIEVSGYISGSLNINVNGSAAGASITSNGTHTQYIVAAGSANTFYLISYTFQASVDNVTIKVPNGNPGRLI